MTAEEKNCHVFCLYFEDGFGEEEVRAATPLIEEADFNQLLQPSTIISYVEKSQCSDARIQKIKAELIKYSHAYKARLGESAGNLCLEVSASGEVLSNPIGVAISEAIEDARN